MFGLGIDPLIDCTTLGFGATDEVHRLQWSSERLRSLRDKGLFKRETLLTKQAVSDAQFLLTLGILQRCG